MIRLQAEAISVAYNGRQALAAVGATVEDGEVVGLVGPNGAGKTTLLKTCTGLLEPERGAVLFEDKPLAEWRPAALARRLAYLPQGASYAWPLRVRRLIALGRLPHLPPWRRPSPNDEAAIDRAMRLADVAHLAGRTADALSGGERARVMLARALAVEPRLLLADEPVSGLDPRHQLQVMEVLKGLAEGGASVVVTLHDLSLAARFCDRLVLLRDGKMMAEGAPAEVLSTVNLETVFGVRAVSGRQDGSLYLLPWQVVNGPEGTAPADKM